MRNVRAYIFSQACRLVCLLALLCGLMSCHRDSDGTRSLGCLCWQEAKAVIATADSLDQVEHMIYSDTAALGRTIRSLDNPLGRLFMRSTLGKAYYYMGRNLEDYHQQIVEAAECYIEADRLQIDDPIYRGRINSCMGYICTQNNNDSLALMFYERASENFKESGNEWYYAQNLLNVAFRTIQLHQFSRTDSLLQLAQTYSLDSAYQARYYETRGLFHDEQQQYDSALVYLQRGLDYWQSEEDKCFSYMKMMQTYYFGKNDFQKGIPLANLIIEYSNNPNYIANAYYCLLLDAKDKNDINLLSRYTHARTDALNLLRNNTNNYAMALPILDKYLHNPYPWCWVWITLFVVVTIFIFLSIRIWTNRQRTDIVRQQINRLSMHVQDQEQRLSFELHYRNLRQQATKAQNKYHTPLNRWQEYSVLKKDLDFCLHDWIESLDNLPLIEREKIFCTLTLVYSHLTDVDIAEYMYYSKSGIRTMKNRMLNKLGISASEFIDFLHKFPYMR